MARKSSLRNCQFRFLQLAMLAKSKQKTMHVESRPCGISDPEAVSGSSTKLSNYSKNLFVMANNARRRFFVVVGTIAFLMPSAAAIIKKFILHSYQYLSSISALCCKKYNKNSKNLKQGRNRLTVVKNTLKILFKPIAFLFSLCYNQDSRDD